MTTDDQGWKTMADYIRQDITRVETSINARIDKLETSMRDNLSSTENRLQSDIKDFHSQIADHIKDEEEKFDKIHERVDVLASKIIGVDIKDKVIGVLHSKALAWFVALMALGTLIWRVLH